MPNRRSKTSPKILIADDSATTRTQLNGLIKHLYPSAHIFQESNADAAWSRFQSTALDADSLQLYDLAILDYEMPPGDGLTVAESIAESKTRCPVILYTTRARRELPDFTDYATYVHKSGHDVTKLLTAIEKLLGAD